MSTYKDYLKNISPGTAIEGLSPNINLASIPLFHFYLNTMIGARYPNWALDSEGKKEMFELVIKDACLLFSLLNNEMQPTKKTEIDLGPQLLGAANLLNNASTMLDIIDRRGSCDGLDIKQLTQDIKYFLTIIGR